MAGSQLGSGPFHGGHIHPMYRSNRPNRDGWVLIVTGGAIALAFPWILLSGQASLFRALLIGAVAALHLAAGIRLVRGPKKGGAA